MKFEEQDFVKEVNAGLMMIESIRKGVARDGLDVPVTLNLNLARQYLHQLKEPGNFSDEFVYLITRAFWNIGVAHGKITQFKGSRDVELQDDKRPDND